MAKFANPFLVGADPEFVFLNPPDLIQTRIGTVETGDLFGFDHNGYVVEPHPTPNHSVRVVCQNIKKSLDYLHHKFPLYRFRAGAMITAPQRSVTLGGHVHLDLPRLSDDQIQAMDRISKALEGFDILPETQCKARRDNGIYGQWGDIRAEHGHVEYRSLCSWLFHPRVSLVSMLCIKLAALNPEGTRQFTSWNTFRNWVEAFKDQDDDVKFVIEKELLDPTKICGMDAAASMVGAWKLNPETGAKIAEAIAADAAAKKLSGVHVHAARQSFQEALRQWREQVDAELATPRVAQHLARVAGRTIPADLPNIRDQWF